MTVWSSHIDVALDRTGYEIITSHSSGIVPYGSHRHAGMEITLVHRGLMQFELGSFSKRLTSGHLALLDAAHPHATRALASPYYRTALHFSPDRVAGRTGANLLSKVQGEGGILFLSMAPDVGERFMWACRHLATLSRKPQPCAIVEHLLGVIASDVATLNGHCASGLSQELWDIVEYMQSNPDSQECITDLAKRFFISPSHLQRLFRRHLGCPPYQYWLKLRLEKACEYLAGTLPVKEVAGALGFGSLSGFERAFGREYGLTPSEYRQTLNVGVGTPPCGLAVPNEKGPLHKAWRGT